MPLSRQRRRVSPVGATSRRPSVPGRWATTSSFSIRATWPLWRRNCCDRAPTKKTRLMTDAGLRIGGLTLPSRLLIAPMAGITDYPFRAIARRYGAGLTYCEFVAADGIVRENKAVLDRLKIRPDERPIGIQIFGAEPEVLSRSARWLIERFAPDILDINYGCPVPKVARKGAGVAALKDLGLMRELTTAVVEAAGDTTVTVKMRMGWSESTIVVPEAGPILESCGVKAITLHGRTSRDRYKHPARWEFIRRLKEAVSIPVIGNGDVFDERDALRMLDETGCDGVMVARAVQGNPWLIRRLVAALNGEPRPADPHPVERIDVCLEHLELEIIEMGERVGLDRMRKQFAWYLKRSSATRPIVHDLVRVNDVTEARALLLDHRHKLQDKAA
ncbi:MAG: tRNA dihydrouridine synthase DusB [Candidatus Dadabacteria bacterium]|nr:MAG: tRNA dihydrouridine synthase DusB [Candidatus Dadabacteria bacterium]